jgi:glycerol-3-phosphate dehydrogenase
MVFRVYVNDDLVGAELCAAAKNVIALVAGGVDGLRLSDNAKASLMTAPVLRDLSHRLEVELPITEGVCRVLDGESLSELFTALMGRQPTVE